MEFFFCKAVKGHRIGDSKTYKKEGADERPSGWKEASEPCLKTHLHCEHSIFLRVCFFELSLKEGQVSRQGLPEAVFTEETQYIQRLYDYWTIHEQGGGGG